VQLQAIVAKNEEIAASLRLQISQLQASKTDKTGEAKKAQEKLASVETRYKKLKEDYDALKLLNSQNEKKIQSKFFLFINFYSSNL
jgi:hypothetical protein